MNPAARALAVLAVAVLIPACNFTFSSDDPFGGPAAPQNPFTLQIPVDGSTGVLTTNTQFAWGALPGATSYQLEISLTSDFSQIIYDQPNILVPSVFVSTGLTRSSTYYWRVRGFSMGPSQLAGGSPYQFTTLPPPNLTAPGQFFMQSPLGGPTPVAPPPIFLWTISPAAAYYTFELDTSNLFLNPVVDLPTVHFNQLTCPITLAAGTTYYWRVTAVNVWGVTQANPIAESFFTP
jgi:trimeric autotransporter adhesin